MSRKSPLAAADGCFVGRMLEGAPLVLHAKVIWEFAQL